MIEGILIKKRMTTFDLAQRLEMTKTGVEYILKQGSTKLSTVYKLAEVLDVEPEDLFIRRAS